MSDAPQAPAPSSSASANTSANTGLAPNVAGALSYLLGVFTGIFFLVTEKQNQFVRFHAAQSIVVSAGIFVLWIAVTVLDTVLAVVPIIGWVIGLLLSLGLGVGGFVLWLVLMYRAYQGREWEVPIAGAQARKLIAPKPMVQ